MGSTESVPEIEVENETILTWNGAKSYGSVNDPLVSLFFKSVRNISCTDYRCIPVKKSKKEKGQNYTEKGLTLEQYFDEAWEEDSLRALKFIFYLRDCRGGKGEKKLFRALVRHMRVTDRMEHIRVNMNQIPYFGSWKDISLCFFGTDLENEAISLIANQLKADKETNHPSLCAKYAPSEGGAIDKKQGAAGKIAEALGVSLTHYRKKYLVPLRKKINVLERQMCASEWNQIQYETVPSIANMRYQKAFRKHDEARYKDFLEKVMSGKKKMNTSVLMPYQMVATYLRVDSDINETTEAQWKSFLDDRKTKWLSGLNVLPLIDVSSSMFSGGDPSPVNVAVSLGMIFSLMNSEEHFRGKFITFHENPQLLQIPEGSLRDQVSYIKATPWGGSTNIQSAFDLILNCANLYKVPSDAMPKILLILSDMQFNQADNVTNWEAVTAKYEAAGYDRPTIIFWNLNGTTIDYPVPNADVPNCALLSGFNDNIFYSIIDGKLPNPRDIVYNVLDNERYSQIHLA